MEPAAASSDVEFSLFRRRVAPLLLDERLAAAAAEGRLRFAQLQFARDARRYFGAAADGRPRTGFAKICVGAGKSLMAALVVVGLLGGAQPRGTRTRILLLAPSDGARRNLAELIRPSTPAESLLVRCLGVPIAEATALAEHALVYDGCGVRTETFRRAWVVISTPQLLAKEAARLQSMDFSELVIDEGDYGTLRTRQSTERSWCRIAERLSGAHVVLISATNDRADGRSLPTPFSVYSYGAALRDKVVKRLNVTYLVPPYVSIREQIGGPAMRVSYLTRSQRSLVSSSLPCLEQLIRAGVDLFLEHRQRSGVPWQLHVVVSKAKAQIADVHRLLQAELAPHRLRAVTVWSGLNSAERAQNEEALSNYTADAVVSCKVFARSVSYALLAVTLNLKGFRNMAGKDAYYQAVVGRSIRRVELEAPEIRRHPQYQSIRRALGSGALQDCLVIECDPLDNRPLLLALAAEQSVSDLRETRHTLPAGLEADAVRRPPATTLQSSRGRHSPIAALLPAPPSVVRTAIDDDHFVLLGDCALESELAAVAMRQVQNWNALARSAALHRIEFFESRILRASSFTAREVARGIRAAHGEHYRHGQGEPRAAIERKIASLLWIADLVFPDDRIAASRDHRGGLSYQYLGSLPMEM